MQKVNHCLLSHCPPPTPHTPSPPNIRSPVGCQYPSADLVKTHRLFPKVSLSGCDAAHVCPPVTPHPNGVEAKRSPGLLADDDEDEEEAGEEGWWCRM